MTLHSRDRRSIHTPVSGFLVLAYIVTIGCSDPVREEVISRFSGGEKRVVAIYRGSGADEQLIERSSYDLSGALILLEDLETGLIQDFLELNPQIRTGAGLREFLEGEWHEHANRNIGRSYEASTYQRFQFSDSRLDEMYRVEYVDDRDAREDSGGYGVEYLDGLRLSVTPDEGDITVENDIERPDLMDQQFDVEVHDSQTVTLSLNHIYEGRNPQLHPLLELALDLAIDQRDTLRLVTVPVATAYRIHRVENVSRAFALAWSIERAGLIDERRDRRDEKIEQDFPEWAASLDARSKEQAIESLRELMGTLDVTADRYRRLSGLSLDEFVDRYGMTPDEF